MLPYAINFSEPQIRNLSKEKQLNSCVTKQCYVTHYLVTSSNYGLYPEECERRTIGEKEVASQYFVRIKPIYEIG